MLSVLCELTAPLASSKSSMSRIITASIGIGLLVAISFHLLAYEQLFSAFLLTILSGYRCVNFLRIISWRMRPVYLRQVSHRTTIWLAGAQTLFWLAAIFWHHHLHLTYFMSILLCLLQIVFAAAMLRTVRGHAGRSEQPVGLRGFARSEWPSVTVAIAARNETDSLMLCLESVLASNYPKLEVLVLDDCSQTRRTPEIIRSFAHDGVRFIPGTEPKAPWLARNHAYKILSKSANGTYLLFVSTSIRMQPDTIDKLVGYAQARDKKMVSVMPSLWPTARLQMLEPMRAAWELLLPRRLFRRPPVSRSCWLVEAAALRKAGGFDGVSQMVTPEAHFARRFTAHDGYSFIPGGNFFGVSSQKSTVEQRASLIRTSYPSLHRRPEMVLAVGALLVGAGVLPFLQLFAAGCNSQLIGLTALSAISVTLLLLAYRQVLLITYPSATLQEIISFPVAVCAMIGLEQYSMYKYEFSEVLWKDRDICIPVMQTIQRLPKI